MTDQDMKKWWELSPKSAKKQDLLNALVKEFNMLEGGMRKHHEMAKEYETLYSESFGEKASPKALIHLTGGKKISFNILKSAVNAAHNKLAKILPRPSFLTQNKPYTLRQTAKELDIWALNQLKKGGAYDAFQRAFHASCICNYGVVKITKGPKTIDMPSRFKFKNIDPLTFYVIDPDINSHKKDVMGERNLYHVHEVISMYPSKKKEIMEKHSEDMDEMIEVFEIYKAEKAHAVFTENTVLSFKEYHYEVLPYIPFLWNYKLRGFIGSGIVEEGYGYQQRVIRILERISKAIDLVATPHILVRKGSKIGAESFTNTVGSIIDYAETEPKFLIPPAFHQQVFDHLSDIIARWERQIGMGDLYLSGELPKGFDPSGVALMHYHDIESERFQVIRARYEECFVQATKFMCMTAEKSMLPPKLEEADLAGQIENIEIYPANLIPSTPSGQYQTLNQLFQMGIATADELISHMDAPDMKRLASSKAARKEACEIIIERSLEEKNEIPLDPVLGEDIFVEKARTIYAEISKEPSTKDNEDRLLILSKFISQVTAEIEKKQKRIMQEQMNESIQKEKALNQQKELAKMDSA